MLFLFVLPTKTMGKAFGFSKANVDDDKSW